MTEDYVDAQEFSKLMDVTYITTLTWIKRGVISNYQKKLYRLGKYKYLIHRSELDRIKALRE